jgi:hypothetical protein
MQLVKVISTEVGKATERIVKALRFGSKDTQTMDQVAPFGVDANPIKDMVAVYAPTSEKGETVVIGYINKNQVAGPGEHRLFSVDANGEVKFFIWLKSDGTLQIGGDTKNLVRYQELESAFNSLKQSHNELVNAFNTHMHATAGTGPPSIPTPGSGIPAQPADADITPAKIEEIKTL